MRTWIVFAFLILGSSSFGYAQGLSQQELDALRARLMQNWNPPIENGGEIIKLRVSLNRNGSLQIGPQVLTMGSGPQFNALRDSAVKAVIESAPFTMLNQQSYEAWKVFDFTFDPRAQLHAPAAAAQQSSAQVNTLAMPPADGKPSFDCSKAKSASARLICSDAELSKADGVLGAKFKAAIVNMDQVTRKKLVEEQLVWLRARNKRCGVGPDKAGVPVDQMIGAKPCMMQAISQRIAMLPAGVVPRTIVGPSGSTSAASAATEKPKFNPQIIKERLEARSRPQPTLDVKNLNVSTGLDCDQPMICAGGNKCNDVWAVRINIFLNNFQDNHIFDDTNSTIQFLNSVREKNRAVCDKARAANQPIGQFRRETSIAVNGVDNARLVAFSEANDRPWQILENQIPAMLRAKEDQIRASQQAEQNARAARERAQQAKVELRARVWKDLGIQKMENLNDISANPYLFKDMVIGIYATFGRMLSENEAVFSSRGEFVVSGVPTTMFRGGEEVILAVRILGNKPIKGLLMGAPMEINVPYGEYVGVYKCANRCQEYFD